MKVVVRLSGRNETRALPLLLRHSSGMALPQATYIIEQEAARMLREARIGFAVITREASRVMVKPTVSE